MRRGSIWTWLIIIAVIVIAYFVLTADKPETPESITKCIGDNSILYVKLGCHYCELQQEMFGNYTNHLNIIDCFYEIEKCENIRAYPTWIIDGEEYSGLKSVETLQNLTGC